MNPISNPKIRAFIFILNSILKYFFLSIQESFYFQRYRMAAFIWINQRIIYSNIKWKKKCIYNLYFYNIYFMWIKVLYKIWYQYVCRADGKVLVSKMWFRSQQIAHPRLNHTLQSVWTPLKAIQHICRKPNSINY